MKHHQFGTWSVSNDELALVRSDFEVLPTHLTAPEDVEPKCQSECLGYVTDMHRRASLEASEPLEPRMGEYTMFMVGAMVFQLEETLRAT